MQSELLLALTIGFLWFTEWRSSKLTLFWRFALRLGSFSMSAVILWYTGSLDLRFFQTGDWNRFATGMHWLGFAQNQTWREAFSEFIPMITAVTAVALYLPNRKSLSLKRLTPHTVFAVVLFAALNAWIEELAYRILPLSLSGINPQAAVWVSALAFGLPHYFGFPSRLPGAALATFLGWFLAQMTVQTGGILGPWVVHWIQDMLILLILNAAHGASPFRILTERPTTAIAQGFALLLLWVASFQLALALGVPWGAAAWGGQNTGILPLGLRMGSAVAILIYVGIGALFLAKTKVILVRTPERALANWTKGTALVLSLGAVLNAISPSAPERMLMTPIATALALAAISVAWSRGR